MNIPDTFSPALLNRTTTLNVLTKLTAMAANLRRRLDQIHVTRLQIIDLLISYSRLVGQFIYSGRVSTGSFELSTSWSIVSMLYCIIDISSLVITSRELIRIHTSVNLFRVLYLYIFMLLLKFVSRFNSKNIKRVFRKLNTFEKNLAVTKKSHNRSLINNILLLIFPLTILYDSIETGRAHFFDSVDSTVMGLALITYNLSVFTIPYLHTAITYNVLYLLADVQHDIINMLQEKCESLWKFQDNTRRLGWVPEKSNEFSTTLLTNINFKHAFTGNDRAVNKSSILTQFSLYSNFSLGNTERKQISQELQFAENLLLEIDTSAIHFFTSRAYFTVLQAVNVLMLMLITLYTTTESFLLGCTPDVIAIWITLTALADIIIVCNTVHNFNKQRFECERKLRRLMADSEDLHLLPSAGRILETLSRPLSFDLLGFGEMNRAFLLGAMDGVASYLIIALEFRLSGGGAPAAGASLASNTTA
ncbi:Gustatory receptor 88 [Hyalella azteca]|uniref:Gustatory receptor 88 n=1 Tax=Hyalella azteca TaxID=294128 RepID=A0A6A0HH99_HYAAZ|nr:Gustatory receptor 88 [Hyalella azteca]